MPQSKDPFEFGPPTEEELKALSDSTKHIQSGRLSIEYPIEYISRATSHLVNLRAKALGVVRASTATVIIQIENFMVVSKGD